MPLKEIKLKPDISKPKMLESAARAPKIAMREAWLKSKEKTVLGLKETPFAGQNEESSNTPANSAANQTVSGMKTAAQKGADLTYRGGKKLAQTASRKVREKREASRVIKEAKDAAGQTGKAVKDTVSKTRIKNTAAKTIKGKPQKTVKTAGRSIKGVKQGAKSVKTAQRSAKAAQKTAQAAARTAQKAAQAARAAARAAAEGAKALAKAAVAVVKATIAIVKSLIAAIAAGGWVAVVVILAICLIAAIIYSCYGIFFSGEDTGTGITMQAAVAEINEEYSERLDHLKEENEHEVFRLSGSRAPWKDVLAVYAVKVNTDSENPQVVANLTEEKKELLRGVFWDMNTISHQIGRETITEIVVQTDEKGNAVEKEQTVEKTVLTVSVTHKPAEEMAARYFFNPSQKAALTELLAPEFDTLWTGVLSGMISDGGGLVAVARSQVGNIGGELYWSWYGFESHVEWCACFVSWCADQCGYIDAGLLPKFAACTSQGVPWFQERGQWQDNTYTPNPGDLIFFNWDQDEWIDHVGIVEKVENGRIYTIEGNSGNACEQNSYPLGDSQIYGYGILRLYV